MGVISKLNISDNTTIDGATYHGATVQKRNIIITAQMYNNYTKHRELLYRVFRNKDHGVFTYSDNSKVKSIDYIVESIEIGEKGIVRNIIISLICPSPFFYDLNKNQNIMSGWAGLFEFPYEFSETGKSFAKRFASESIQILDEGTAIGIGVTIIINADGPISNPFISLVETEQTILINTTLNYGDKLIITTDTNNKNVVLVRDGYSEIANEYLDVQSEFMMISPGYNTFFYGADSGADFMSVNISYRQFYVGV